jgi:DNA-binding CsgD family transcriptional regulator
MKRATAGRGSPSWPILYRIVPRKGQTKTTSGTAESCRGTASAPPVPPTPAEMRVATILGAGCGTVGASRHLAVSENTVKTHAKRIYEKMGLKSHGELVQLFGRLAVSAHA